MILIEKRLVNEKKRLIKKNLFIDILSNGKKKPASQSIRKLTLISINWTTLYRTRFEI